MSKIFFLLSVVVVTFLFSDVYVNGYYRSNGTYVEPHYRSSPNDTKSDNWSTYGNVNPHTGEEGTKRYYDYNNYGRSGGNSNYYDSGSYDRSDENYYSKYGIYSSNDCIKMDTDGAIDDCVNYFMGESKSYKYSEKDWQIYNGCKERIHEKQDNNFDKSVCKRMLEDKLNLKKHGAKKMYDFYIRKIYYFN